MKVCVIIPSFYPAEVYGGWIASSLSIYKELALKGVKIYVSTTNDNGNEYLTSNSHQYVKLSDNLYVKYYPQLIRERFSISLLLNLYKDIAANDIVRVHGIFSQTTPFGLFFAAVLGKKVIISPHGCLGQWCLSDGSRLKKVYLALFVKPFANRITWHATSQQEAEEIKNLFPTANGYVIPHGIEFKDYETQEELNREEYIKKYTGMSVNKGKIIVSMGRLHRKKGFDLLIRAFRETLTEHSDALLMIAGGDFGEQKILEELILELKLKDKVFLVGHLTGRDKIIFLANADLFVLASHNENFGMVYAEAMALGTPVVASIHTPWRELEDLGLGKCIDNNVANISLAINKMLEKDLSFIGVMAKQYIINKYSIAKSGLRFLSLFSNLLGEKK